MFKKKYYLSALFIGILIFFILFAASYYYISAGSNLSQQSNHTKVTQHEKSVDVLANEVPLSEEVIGPDTRVHLLIVDKMNYTVEDKEMDALSLAGNTKEDIKDKFKDYEVAAFSKDEVMLKKTLADETNQLGYTLGIEDSNVCIIEEGNPKRFTTLNIPASNFSRNTYSMLLKEQIKISAAQKNELLSDPNYIERILQSYEEE